MKFGNRKIYLENDPYLQKDTCPFCKKNEYYIDESSYWTILYNKNPYYGHKQNLLVVPKRHITYVDELTDNEILDIKNIEIWMKKYFWDKNYFSFIRNSIHGRSVEHLHYHYLEWDLYHDPNAENKQSFIIKNVS